MNKLKQYAYTVSLVTEIPKLGRLEYPLKVIADTPDGMCVEPQDVWNALGYTNIPEFDESAALEFESKALMLFQSFTSVRIRRTTAPGINKGYLTQVFLRGKAFTRSLTVYFTWENTLAQPLNEDDVDCLSFGGVVDLVDSQFPEEFVWDTETYIGKHVSLPVSIYARGASVGITKVHVDVHGEKQQVFRGDPVRILDLVVQAKANCQSKGLL